MVKNNVSAETIPLIEDWSVQCPEQFTEIKRPHRTRCVVWWEREPEHTPPVEWEEKKWEEHIFKNDPGGSFKKLCTTVAHQIQYITFVQ
jgi:hypothetical protein